MEVLTSIVKDMILNQNVSHKDIIKHIEKVVLDMGKELPKHRVLYNKSYGGYGLSDVFLDFVSSKEDENKHICPYLSDSRIYHERFIIPFGQYIFNNYPLIQCIITLYHYYDLYNITNSICRIYVHNKTLSKYKKQLDFIQCIMDNKKCHGDKEISKEDIDNRKYDINTISNGYCLSTYKHIYNSLISSISELNEYKKSCERSSYEKYNGPNGTWDILYEDIQKIIFQLKKEDDDNLFPKPDRGYDFMTAVQTFTETNSIIWSKEYQNKYNEYAMRYLYIKYNETELNYNVKLINKKSIYDFLLSKQYIHIVDDTMKTITEEFGLLCASSEYCNLHIQEVPQLIHWKIKEYDGLEQIVYR